MIDLLQRQQNPVEVAEMTGARVLVTGAAGSVGIAVVCELLRNHADVTALDASEEGLFWARKELPKASWKLGRIDDLRDVSGFDLVIHAAAYKHVGVLEDCPEAGIVNNCGPTVNLAGLCWLSGVHFCLISTDKSVEASSIMGKTKFVAERCVDSWRHLGLKATILRFANVLGSSGSVLDVWQNRENCTIRATRGHRRWFITPREAATGILRACQVTDTERYLFAIRPDEETEISGLARRFAERENVHVEYQDAGQGEKEAEVFCYENQFLEKIEGFLYAIRRSDLPDALCQPGVKIQIPAGATESNIVERL